MGILASGSSDDDRLRIWKLGSGVALFLGIRRVRSVALSPDDQTLASGSSDNTIKIWKLVETTPLWTYGSSYSVALAPDGQLLISGVDKTIKLGI